MAVSCEAEPEPEPGGSAEAGGEQELLLRRGDLLALGSRLKEALETYSAALRLGPPPGPRRLDTLVGCLVLHYRLRHGLRCGRGRPEAGGPLRCCGCRGFLSEPVTAPCGHSYCRRCLRRELWARCRRCRERLPAPPPPRINVVLNQLAEKWFPAECERARGRRRLAELLGQGRFREALGAASRALRAGG